MEMTNSINDILVFFELVIILVLFWLALMILTYLFVKAKEYLRKEYLNDYRPDD